MNKNMKKCKHCNGFIPKNLQERELIKNKFWINCCWCNMYIIDSYVARLWGARERE